MRTFAQQPKAAQQTASARSAVCRQAISILRFERTLGNQAARTSLRDDAGLAGSPSPGLAYDFSRIPIGPPDGEALQTKLAINKPGDPYEREADHIADRVMRMPEPGLQRMCPQCEEEDRLAGGHIRSANAAASAPVTVSRKAAGPKEPADGQALVGDVLSGSGRPLDPAVRSFMEPRFGHDFSRVRIHTGPRAAESARAVNAIAYTVGRHVVFDQGAYRPDTASGRRLIAHELTHVMQQGGVDTGVQPDSENEFGDSGVRPRNGGLHGYTSSGPRIQRQSGCSCCVTSVSIANISRIDNATHMGHSYDLVINMTRSTEFGPRLEQECTLEWWEKTNVPYTTGMAANTWTNMFLLLPSSPTLSPWVNRSLACDTSATVTITDPPALGKRPGRTVTRTLEFDLKVKSGPGGTCANAEKSAQAKQVLAMVNGAPDWASSSFT